MPLGRSINGFVLTFFCFVIRQMLASSMSIESARMGDARRYNEGNNLWAKSGKLGTFAALELGEN